MQIPCHQKTHAISPLPSIKTALQENPKSRLLFSIFITIAVADERTDGKYSDEHNDQPDIYSISGREEYFCRTVRTADHADIGRAAAQQQQSARTEKCFESLHAFSPLHFLFPSIAQGKIPVKPINRAAGNQL